MAGIVAAHEALTDQKRVVCRSLQLPKVAWGFQPALSDRYHFLGNQVDSLMADIRINAERPQIAVIDANDRRPGVQSSRQLREIVDFDEHIETGVRCRAMKLLKRRL